MLSLFLTVGFLTLVISSSSAFTGSCQSRRPGRYSGNGNAAQSDATVLGRVCLSAAVSVDDIDNLGLLRNVDVTQDKYYALDLEVKSKDDLAWLRQPGLAWEAAEKDAAELNLPGAAEYINSVRSAIRMFAKTGIVHDREDLYTFLNDTASDASFALLLGGKSVGKSLILKDFVTRANKGELKTLKGQEIVALYLNGRKTSNQPVIVALRAGWKNLARDFPGIFGQTNQNEFLSFVGKVFGASSELNLKEKEWFPNLSVSKSVLPLITLALDTLKVNENVAVEVFITKAEENGRFPVLVIDEANEVLGEGEGANATSTFLKTLVALTKEDNRMAVILASSEHSYPFDLEMKYGMNLQDIGKVRAFANEIPPYSMWDLLTNSTYETGILLHNITAGNKKIGMGPNLAKLFISAYGGHFLNVQQALSNLAQRRDAFALEDSLNEIHSEVMLCLNTDKLWGAYGMVSLLEQMASRGFAPVEDIQMKMTNGHAFCVSKNNVGGAIKKGSLSPGVPPELWLVDGKEVTYALIPTSQSARLVIAAKTLAWRLEHKEECIRNSEAKSKGKKSGTGEMDATRIVALNKAQQAKVNAKQHLVEEEVQPKKNDNKMQLMRNNLEIMKMRKEAQELDPKLTLENLNEMFPLHNLSEKESFK
mmetsp:Transcript_5657/g.9967  ORF Transcript_5657/g.9967 Transcript_5657/m.9967 type:complete len:650 (-) Transcript_5657:180-2129(-)|eukprot:CAMPEP_0198284244 /NCGR_PEP_ID=MMETSP1449-20131203/3729_1 /TAXON_ID=420275 /ORGANISM="Attheya septentrionalis, Strain CCMP2084" /LENGTH=649 /DNA_ID=CAMNT_0043981213 /DNA_START=51 /DNA_END=2000 /DNA_ORIENTATION=-